MNPLAGYIMMCCRFCPPVPTRPFTDTYSQKSDYARYHIPKELQDELRMLEEEQIHYKSSFTGLHNGFLACHFLPSLSFLVKPMARRLQSPDTSCPDPITGEIYIGRFEPLTDLQGQPGPATSRADVTPDFTVCKLPGRPRGPISVLIWELKREDAGSTGGLQIMRYAEWAREYQRTTPRHKDLPPINVFLVEKGKVTSYTLDSDGDISSSLEYPSVLSPDLHDKLRELAEANWDV